MSVDAGFGLMLHFVTINLFTHHKEQKNRREDG